MNFFCEISDAVSTIVMSCHTQSLSAFFASSSCVVIHKLLLHSSELLRLSQQHASSNSTRRYEQLSLNGITSLKKTNFTCICGTSTKRAKTQNDIHQYEISTSDMTLKTTSYITRTVFVFKVGYFVVTFMYAFYIQDNIDSSIQAPCLAFG
jgi:uncharacterized membrane protein